MSHSFYGIVGVLLGDVAGGREQFFEHAGVGRCPVGGNLAGSLTVVQGAVKEPACRRQIPFLGHQRVDDLPILVDRPVQIDPAPRDLGVCFVNEPTITGCMPTGPGCVDEQRGEPLNPAVDRDVVNHDAPLGQQLFDISIGEPVAAGTSEPRA
jgi:hypothetical protein